jgi:hypothetical protein
METNKTALTQVKANPDNPRIITDENLALLVNSILEFPKMLEIRPLVVDEQGVILGGNQRHKALTKIAAMSEDELQAAITELRSTESKTPDEVAALRAFWTEWAAEPYAYVTNAATLTQADREAFVIKDNVNFGTWDYDLLDNYDQDDLADWGLKTWGALEPLMTQHNASDTAAPSDHQRIIIIFPKERRAEVENFLRLKTPGKSVYKISELLNTQSDESNI